MSARLIALVVLVVAAGCGGAPVPAPSGTTLRTTASPIPSPTPSSPPLTERPTPTATPSPTPTPTAPPTPPPLQGLALDLVADGLKGPLDVRARPGDGALFVAEQRGIIRAVRDGTAGEPLLDITDLVNDVSIEQGLLGFAFHPGHPDDPRVFVYHSEQDNDNVLVSYRLDAGGNVLDPGSRTPLLTIDKDPDAVLHNGGTVLFGPDGLLYLSVGDAARYSVNAQNPATLPASVLRIDVDGGDPYAIPEGNPFASGEASGVEGAPEVWWFGLRNPWRMSIDAPTGLAYIADVGQESAEEVNVVPLDEGGLNFGWPAREGTGTFVDVPLVSDPRDPVFEVRHDGQDRGCSITGGEVYRGPAMPELDGHYFYADWCYGWIRSLRVADGAAVDQQDWSADLPAAMVSSFGHDAEGELLVLDWDAGTVSRIVPVREAP